MGLRVLVAERKSRKGDAKEDTRYRRQENKNIRTAESNGHTIIAKVADTVSSQTLPWRRKNLKQWFTNPQMMAMWDAVLISEVSRISRGDSDTWFEIEQWCRANRKFIMDSDGLIWPNADDEKWDEKRRAARDYWEDVRDSHAESRADTKAAGGAIGRAPFGYKIVPREDGYKQFVIDPVTGPLAKEAFKRVSDGYTATSVAIWLSEVTGTAWRVKRVTDMISRRTYLGERDSHKFEALVTVEMWDQANNALAARSFKHKDQGGRRAEHGYSGLLFCECGSKYYHHKSDRGQAKYRCGRGRSGDFSEVRCSFGAPSFDEINVKVNDLMAKYDIPDVVMVTLGGDHAKLMELTRISTEMATAQAKGDMSEVIRLATEHQEVSARETEPIRLEVKETGRTLGEVWRDGELADRRSLLERMVASDQKITVKMVNGEWKADLDIPVWE